MPIIKLPNGAEIPTERIISAFFREAGSDAGWGPSGGPQFKVKEDQLYILIDDREPRPPITGPEVRRIVEELEAAHIPVSYKRK